MSTADTLRRRSVEAAARVVAVVAFAILVYSSVPVRGGRWWVGALAGLATVAAVVPLTIRRFRAIRSTDHPMLAAGEAIALLLTLVVLGFSAVYLAIDQRGDQFVGLETRLDAVYFTVTTLSTVGFGDIHASGRAARLAVTIQVLFDLTMLAVAVRALAGAAQRRRSDGAAARLS